MERDREAVARKCRTEAHPSLLRDGATVERKQPCRATRRAASFGPHAAVFAARIVERRVSGGCQYCRQCGPARRKRRSFARNDAAYCCFCHDRQPEGARQSLSPRRAGLGRSANNIGIDRSVLARLSAAPISRAARRFACVETSIPCPAHVHQADLPRRNGDSAAIRSTRRRAWVSNNRGYLARRGDPIGRPGRSGALAGLHLPVCMCGLLSAGPGCAVSSSCYRPGGRVQGR